MGYVLLILGVGLGVCTLALVKQVSIFGNTCFFVGALTPQTQCLAPGLYFGALGVAAIMVVLGIASVLRGKRA